MNRRTVLRAVGLTGASAVAGCLRLQNRSGSDTATASETETVSGADDTVPTVDDTAGGDGTHLGSGETDDTVQRTERTERGSDPNGASLLPDGECTAPSGSLDAALPDGEFAQQVDRQTTDGADNENIERGVNALYGTSGDVGVGLSITEFVSEEAAIEALGTADSDQSGTDREIGYVRAGRYVYAAFARTREDVIRAMEATEPLSSECVTSTIAFQ